MKKRKSNLKRMNRVQFRLYRIRENFKNKTFEFDKAETPAFIINNLFEFYLWFKYRKFNTLEQEVHNRVYDHLGLIDTLGFSAEVYKYTYSYSSELVFKWGFKLWGFKIGFYEG